MLPTPTHPKRRRHALAGIVVLSLLALPTAPAWAGGSGGTGPDTSSSGDCVSKAKAKLANGKAIPPCSAPPRVVKVIRAANKIAKGKGYCYGGGHSSFKSSCYDCSGGVSYALHGGNFVGSPMPSSGYFSWGRKGKGRWITVYTKSSHMYAVIAGLRWDTSMTPGSGPGWSREMRSSSGYKVRHPKGY